jgi:hypothetical protein
LISPDHDLKISDQYFNSFCSENVAEAYGVYPISSVIFRIFSLLNWSTLLMGNELNSYLLQKSSNSMWHFSQIVHNFSWINENLQKKNGLWIGIISSLNQSDLFLFDPFSQFSEWILKIFVNLRKTMDYLRKVSHRIWRFL